MDMPIPNHSFQLYHTLSVRICKWWHLFFQWIQCTFYPWKYTFLFHGDFKYFSYKFIYVLYLIKITLSLMGLKLMRLYCSLCFSQCILLYSIVFPFGFLNCWFHSQPLLILPSPVLICEGLRTPIKLCTLNHYIKQKKKEKDLQECHWSFIHNSQKLLMWIQCLPQIDKQYVVCLCYELLLNIKWNELLILGTT
jgi:hypothetical protein